MFQEPPLILAVPLVPALLPRYPPLLVIWPVPLRFKTPLPFTPK